VVYFLDGHGEVINQIESPFTGSTLRNSDDVSVCGSTADQGFSIVLQEKSRVTFELVSADFDAVIALRHGGTYPGDYEIDCVDDPDTTPLTFTYTGDGSVDIWGPLRTTVYFVVDGYGFDDVGEYVLKWEIIDSIQPNQGPEPIRGAPCEFYYLVPNAVSLGSCPSSGFLDSGSSCTYIGLPENPSDGGHLGYSCTPSVCLDGVLTDGFCGGS